MLDSIVYIRTGILIHKMKSELLVVALDVLDASAVPLGLVAIGFIRLPHFTSIGQDLDVEIITELELSSADPDLEFAFNHFESRCDLGCLGYENR